MINIETDFSEQKGKFLNRLAEVVKTDSYKSQSLKRYLAIQMFFDCWTVDNAMDAYGLEDSYRPFLTEIFEKCQAMTLKELAEWSIRALNQVTKEVTI